VPILKGRTLVKAIILLLVGVPVLFSSLDAYVAYRYGNISTITVSKLSDLDAVFEVGHPA
jgi:hypothetical protein